MKQKKQRQEVRKSPFKYPTRPMHPVSIFRSPYSFHTFPALVLFTVICSHQAQYPILEYSTPLSQLPGVVSISAAEADKSLQSFHPSSFVLPSSMFSIPIPPRPSTKTGSVQPHRGLGDQTYRGQWYSYQSSWSNGISVFQDSRQQKQLPMHYITPGLMGDYKAGHNWLLLRVYMGGQGCCRCRCPEGYI